MRKLVSLILSLIMVLSLALPAMALAEGEVQKEPARFVIRSNSNKENKLENQKIHDLIEELSGIKFEVIVVPENNWNERVNVMLAGGEEFDCINLTANGGVWSEYAANGFLQPITEEMLDTYLPHVKAMIPEEAWVPCRTLPAQSGRCPATKPSPRAAFPPSARTGWNSWEWKCPPPWSSLKPTLKA